MTETIASYQQKNWDLSELVSGGMDSPELEAAFKRIDEMVSEFETLRPQLTPAISTEEFLAIVARLEEISLATNRLGSFASLSFSADTQSQAAQTLMQRVEQFFAELENRTIFFTLWWKDLSDQDAARLMAPSGDYHYWLEEMRHFKPHTLSEPEEKIINIKNVTGASALQMLYRSLSNRYSFKLTIDGQEKELTRGELMVYVRQHDADLRAQAYQELYRVYGDDGPILGQIYQALVRDWRNEQVTLRKHGSPMAARNLINDLPDDVVNTLLGVCQRNTGVFQRFFKLKARWLQMEKLRRYDIYAPVVKSDKRYNFGAAAGLVLDSFKQFDPKFAELAERVFAQDHLDAEVRKGKRSGAFCATAIPQLTPWVLLNYQGHADDVATMAHELGHSIHSMLAAQHSAFTAHACLPLAETASTFAEMVLVDRLLKEETDEAVRRDLLFRQMDDAYATVQRQAYFALFERDAHELIRQGASVDDLADVYLKNLRQQFGDAVDVSDEFRWEWVSIPHIYDVPFYVYAYTFGQLLVLALYQQYKAEGGAFKPRYIKILAAGGSVAPVQLLADAGIDVRQDAFWQGGFDVLSGIVDQLEKLPVG
ncbi:oligoendopeptidase F [Longilinea arvoryzae]|uniref:Oligoendopeptidase F n=1 Tax=Longilinea arvoryzae TaxID=360412 RepID=A0A0S7BEJ4_9CHLR|nr:M3 family oligoendopeptidase [Longilinea arvoryzae]GAP12456.1 oligoendopeptidase F [Longilinea arvoryzae]